MKNLTKCMIITPLVLSISLIVISSKYVLSWQPTANKMIRLMVDTQPNSAFIEKNSPRKTLDEPFPMQFGICAQWHYRITQGTFRLGAPYIRIRDVCVREESLMFLLPSQEQADALRYCLSYCCNSVWSNTNKCSHLKIPKTLCENLQLFQISIMVVNRSSENPPAPMLRGRTYFLDTAIGKRYQYGHAISKIVQLGLLNETFEHIVINRVDRLPGGFHYGSDESNIKHIFDITVGRLGIPIILAQSNMTCVEELWTIPNYEQMLFSFAAATRWRSLVTSVFGITYPKCPPPRGLFLGRAEGALRRMENSAEIDKLAMEFGIPLTHVSISSQNTSVQHAQLFSSFGFMISSHSSALKTLLFASPNAAVIEMTGQHIPDWGSSPFELGMSFLDIHYVVSKRHTANWTQCGNICEKPNNDRHANLLVNITLLRAAFEKVLASQRRVCPQLAYS